MAVPSSDTGHAGGRAPLTRDFGRVDGVVETKGEGLTSLQGTGSDRSNAKGLYHHPNIFCKY